MVKKKSFVRQKIIKRDCNQCGDYEYCAFDYDKCTGFIPGDNYVFEKTWEEDNKKETS